MNQKGTAPLFLLVALAVLIILVGGICYFGLFKAIINPTQAPSVASTNSSAKSTIDSIENWKTYLDSNNHFSFKYPQGWLIRENNIEEKVGNTPDNNVLTQKGISVYVYENAGNLTVLQFLDTIFYKDYTGNMKVLKDAYMKSYKKNINPNLTIKNGETVYVSEGGDQPYIKPISLDGKQAMNIDVLITPKGSYGNGVWVSLGQNGLLLRGYPSADYKNQQEIFNNIISSFKFIQ